MIARDYHWRPNSRNRRRNNLESKFSFWLMLALVLSLAAHAILWILFDGIRFDQTAKLILTEPFRIKRVTMDAKTMETVMDPGNEATNREQKTDTPDQPAEPSAAALAAQLEEISPEDMAHVLNEEVRITPRAETLENAVLADPSVAAGGREALDLFPEESELPLADSGLATASESSLDPDHPTMPSLDDLTDAIADMDEIAEAGNGRTDITPPGYASLDEVLKMPGGGDPGKPIWVPTDDVLFDFNSAELKEESKLVLMKLGLLIMQRKDSIFILEGYTDLFGAEAYNLALSLNRATAIRDWLVKSLRLDESQLIVRGHGKANPIVLEGDIDQQSPNRRVEITIKPRTKVRPVDS